MNKLIDRYGRIHTYLRISVTDRCNLRCTYCMPKEGIEWKQKEDILTFEEIIRLAKIFTELGIKKIRITGGEPTVRKDLENLIEGLARLSGLETLAMTSNGILLKDKVSIYKRAGLKVLNISLDTLKEKRFREVTFRDNFNDVIEGLNASLHAGFNPLKVNVVVMKNFNDDEILDFVDFVKDKPINIRFIEYMPFTDNGWGVSKLVSYFDIREKIQSKYDLIPVLNQSNNVAKDFLIPGFLGSVSFITSMSDSFCGTCNRVRITADGLLKSCLFYQPELSLRDMLRSGVNDEIIKETILGVIYEKKEGHPHMQDLKQHENQPMIQIGG